MPRRRRRSRRNALSFGSLVGLILSLVFGHRQEAWVALTPSPRTRCAQCLLGHSDVEKDNGEGCGNPAHGRLRACHLVKHKRAKTVLWAMFRLKNPATRYRIMWAQPRSSYGRVSPQPETPEPKVTRPLYDGTALVSNVLMLFLTTATSALAFHLI